MAVNVDDAATVGQVGYATSQLNQKLEGTFKAATNTNNSVAFFTSSDTTGTAAFSFHLPTVVETSDGIEFRSGSTLTYKIPIMKESN